MSEQVITGFHHYALRSRDLLSSVKFFEALGFHTVHEWSLPNYDIDRAVMMQAPDNKSWIEIFDLSAAIPMQGRGGKGGKDVVTGALAHVCLAVTDLQKACVQVIDAGAKHLHGPEALSLGHPSVEVRNAIFEGPAGEVIELLQEVQFPGNRTKQM